MEICHLLDIIPEPKSITISLFVNLDIKIKKKKRKKKGILVETEFLIKIPLLTPIGSADDISIDEEEWIASTFKTTKQKKEKEKTTQKLKSHGKILKSKEIGLGWEK